MLSVMDAVPISFSPHGQATRDNKTAMEELATGNGFAFLFSIYFFIFLTIGLSAAINENEDGIPCSIDYHNSADLLKATGVVFPDVIPVDSMYHIDWCNNYTRVKFVARKGLSHADYKRFDIACKTDSCCWRKDSLGYHYCIYPERPLDRTKGTHKRKVEIKKDDGSLTMVEDWDGDYVSVFVPFKGDTITIEDGWVR